MTSRGLQDNAIIRLDQLARTDSGRVGSKAAN